MLRRILRRSGRRVLHELAALRGSLLSEEECRVETEADRKALFCQRILACSPRRVFREKYFLNLFSGRRRRGDLQDALEAHEPESGVALWVLSLDIMVSGEYCDLLKEDTQELWLRVARMGLAEGLLAGPPCETWSVAREADGMAPATGPRPLRTATSPWGMLDLTPREFQQVDVGNRLMIFALRICLVQASKGKFSLLEHPDDPELHNPSKRNSPTIWRTSVLTWLRQTGLFVELRLEQGHYDQESPKPTRFLLSGIDDAVAHNIALQCRTSERPKASSIGKSGGSFRTAKLKEYTPQLCAMIAQLFLYRSRPPCEALGEAPDQFRWMQSLSVSTFEHESHGPDYAGTG